MFGFGRFTSLDEYMQLQFLEEKHSLSGRHTAKSVVRTVEAEDQFKNLSSALEEVQHKGNLMDRLEMLENRVLQVSKHHYISWIFFFQISVLICNADIWILCGNFQEPFLWRFANPSNLKSPKCRCKIFVVIELLLPA